MWDEPLSLDSAAELQSFIDDLRQRLARETFPKK